MTIKMRLLGILVFFAFLLNSCGDEKSSEDGGPAYSKVNGVFHQAAAENRVPYRLLLAVAYMQSHVNPQKVSAVYVNTLDHQDQRERSITAGQTAFGFTRSKLALADDDTSNDLTKQIPAYAKYIGAQMKALNFPAEPSTIEEKVRWVWEIAKIHVPGTDNLKDLRLVFAKELIEVMNDGFEIQLPDTGEFLKLDKEGQKISEDNLPTDMRVTFRLSAPRGEIRPAFLFNLGSSMPTKIVNKPRGVTVIQCPFSLATCIDMQNPKSEAEVRIGAHYIVPDSTDLVPGIIQVALHQEAVQRINNVGEVDYVQDSIVVMLVGNSGRLVKGIRAPATPEWVTNTQLTMMGSAISLICEVLSDTEKLDYNKCRSVEGVNGASTPGDTRSVVFQYQKGETTSWGDIPDFDEYIFAPYIAQSGGLSGDTAFSFPGEVKQFNAGDVINLNLKFQPRATQIQLERLVRCNGSEGKVVWDSVQNPQVRNENSKAFQVTFYDAGPNGNGDQFFRAKILGDKNEFLGWAIDRVNLRNYDKKRPTGYSNNCLRSGT